MSYLDLSPEQIDILISFAEDNPHLAFGRIGVNSELQYEYEFKWKEVMRDINYLDKEHIVRGVREYRAYWTKLKSRVQNKVNRARRLLKMSEKPTKVALTDYELRVFNVMPKSSKDKYLVIEGVDDKNSSKSIISIKEEHVARPELNINKNLGTILKDLENIADSIQNVARIQVELTKGQLEMVKSMNNMAELFRKIKQDYSQLCHEN